MPVAPRVFVLLPITADPWVQRPMAKETSPAMSAIARSMPLSALPFIVMTSPVVCCSMVSSRPAFCEDELIIR